MDRPDVERIGEGMSKVLAVLSMLLSLCALAFSFVTGLAIIEVHVPELDGSPPKIIHWLTSTSLKPDSVLEAVFRLRPNLGSLILLGATLALILFTSTFIEQRIRRKLYSFTFSRSVLWLFLGAVTGSAHWLLVIVTNSNASHWWYWAVIITALIGYWFFGVAVEAIAESDTESEESSREASASAQYLARTSRHADLENVRIGDLHGRVIDSATLHPTTDNGSDAPSTGRADRRHNLDLYFIGFMASWVIWGFFLISLIRFVERHWHVGIGSSLWVRLIGLALCLIITGAGFFGALSLAAACDDSEPWLPARERIQYVATAGIVAMVGVGLWVWA